MREYLDFNDPDTATEERIRRSRELLEEIAEIWADELKLARIKLGFHVKKQFRYRYEDGTVEHGAVMTMYQSVPNDGDAGSGGEIGEYCCVECDTGLARAVRSLISASTPGH